MSKILHTVENQEQNNEWQIKHNEQWSTEVYYLPGFENVIKEQNLMHF